MRQQNVRVAAIALLAGVLHSSCASQTVTVGATAHANKQEEFEKGLQRLEELATTERNEFLAFFVAWDDNVYTWGRWTEGTRTRVDFPFNEWVPMLCTPRIKRVIIAHTHPNDSPPSEVDVGLMWSMERALVKCGIGVAQIVVTPTTTWELSPATPDESGERCRQYDRLFANKHTPYVQRDIEKVARTKSSVMLVTYYRCAVGIRARYFERETPISRQ